MEYNYFLDYSKADNGEDEDLQSRLYAEIYYTRSEEHILGAKNDIVTQDKTATSEKYKSRNEAHELTQEPGNSKTKNLAKNSNISAGNSKLFMRKEQDTELHDTKKTNTGNMSSTSEGKGPHFKKGIKSKQNKVTKESTIFMGHCSDIVKPAAVDALKFSATCGKVAHKAITKPHVNSNVGENINPERQVQSKGNIQNIIDIDGTVDVNVDLVIDKKTNSLNCDKEKAKSALGKDTEANKGVDRYENYQHIFKKYTFSKAFINKLYLEKYQDLEKKLQEVGTHNDDVQVDNANVELGDETELDTRYTALGKKDKQKQKETADFEKQKEQLDCESDSAESILEVPIPPKPKPPVIQLQDSDDDGDRNNDRNTYINDESITLSSDSGSSDQECSKQMDNNGSPTNSKESRVQVKSTVHKPNKRDESCTSSKSQKNKKEYKRVPQA